MPRATLNQLLLDSFRQYNLPDLLWCKAGGSWRKMSTQDFLRSVVALSHALREFGIAKGDRVAIFSENRPEWHISDFAVLGLGAIIVPIYQTESVERAKFLLEDSAARICFVSGAAQFDKVAAVWPGLPTLEKVVAFAPVGDARVVAWQSVAGRNVHPQEMEDFERAARAVGPNDVASLIYTSGTTGAPKGVLLTQHNFASNVLAVQVLGFSRPDVALSMLPLCHVYERMNAYCYLVYGVPLAYAESIEAVPQNLLEVRPTVMATVPRFFEKFYARIQEQRAKHSPLKRELFDWAVEVGRKTLPYRLRGQPVPGGLAWRQRLAAWLVYRKIQARLGGRMRLLISGGGPLSRELNEFLQALHVPIYEGYGLTETSPVVAVNAPGRSKIGTVGKPIPGVEVRIAEDGEILTRGPHVMKAYYKREQETRAAMANGWFHTGDIGFLDEEGYLVITDRKRDVLKTSGGKMIAPQAIENRLKASPYIQNAVVVGDGRKYASALVVPNFATLEQFAHDQGINPDSREALIAHPAVKKLFEEEVGKVNTHLAQFERIKRFAVLSRDFSFSDGELTYTEKVRRRQIEEKYRVLIDSLYPDEPRSTA